MTVHDLDDGEAAGGNSRVDAGRSGLSPPPGAAAAAQNFHAAVSFHQRGQLGEAEQLYRAVLQIDDSNFHCLHNLGLVFAQGGRFDEAAAMLRAAIRQDPRSVDAHSNLGNVLAARGDRDGAAASFRCAIALKPDHAEARNNLGTVLAMRGEAGEAMAQYQQALALAPDHVEARVNLGNLLREQGRLDEAAVHLARALTTRPRMPEVHYHLGSVQRRRGKIGEAAACYERAIALKPDFAEAHCDLGIVLLEQRRPAAAQPCFERALALKPGASEAWLGLGHVFQQAKRYDDALAAYGKASELPEAWLGRGLALQRLKRLDEAVAAYRQALAKGGDADVARYNLASLGAEAVPSATPRQIVARTYDQYAVHYDQHHLGPLKYQTPALLFDAVARFVPAAKLDILDLGCGTGLSGARFHPLARTLTGIDISSGMLDVARGRRIYDNLVCDDLIAFLQAQAGTFDLAVAADVFVYIGDLTAVFAGVHGALRAGGLFGFSVEAGPEQEFALRANLRYAHSLAYLRKLSENQGFAMELIEQKILRQEDGNDVAGILAVLRRL
ncbi:MAG TPA: tetratricopeptide repeat protein [Xanthobacteraceae bacterium]